MKARFPQLAAVTALAVWTLAACGGMGLMMASTRRPDVVALAQAAWPAGLALPTVAGRPTLVTCLHPRCPCSDATLDVLERFLPGSPPTTAVLLFAVPDHAGTEWTDAPLVRRARETPGVCVVLDFGGRQCALLGARSSGQTFLYDAAGRLRFEGGLTPGRGETGDWPDAGWVHDTLAGPAAGRTPSHAAVFGCALYRPSPSEAAR